MFAFIAGLFLFAQAAPVAGPSSTKEAEVGMKWVKEKANDRRVGGDLKKLSMAIEAAYAPLNQPRGAGTFDPMQCWTPQIAVSKILNAEAEKDAKLDPSFRKQLQQDLRIIVDCEKRWKSASKKTKQERLKKLEMFIALIQKTGKKDVRKALQQIADDHGQTKAARELAEICLRAKPPHCIPSCCCVGTDRCPCCGWETVVRGILINDWFKAG